MKKLIFPLKAPTTGSEPESEPEPEPEPTFGLAGADFGPAPGLCLSVRNSKNPF